MQKRNNFLIIVLAITLVVACGKGSDNSASTNPTPTPTPTPTPVSQICTLTGVIQANGGGAAEYVLTINRDASNNPIGFNVFDSALMMRKFQANLNYVTTDSIVLGTNQYIKLDANKRVIRFSTLSDFDNPGSADIHLFTYDYNAQGYLSTKRLFINGAANPSYITLYTYNNGLLTDCIMNAGTIKVFESTLTYDNATVIKDWIYTFPDGFESFILSTGLNFGTKCLRPLTRIVSKVYNPANNQLLDTWTTNYSSYSFNSSGYITSGVASGDLQQGIAHFYGKTRFNYTCQ